MSGSGRIREIGKAAFLAVICLSFLIAVSGAIYAAANMAPEWKGSAIKTDTATVTLGNPYTPAEYITNKWTDPDGEDNKLVYYYSVDDGDPELCEDYTGAADQVQYFAYTFKTVGKHTLKVWANDGKADSEAYVAAVTVVDPATYEYTMTIMAAPKNADLTFYKCEGFDENGHDVTGEQIKHKSHKRGDDYHAYTIKLKAGTYSFRAEDTAGNDLGGSTFQVPAEAKIAGASETTICIREVDMGCTTMLDETNYCTSEHFKPHIVRSGHEATFGSTYVSGGVTYYRTMVVASGNDMVYQHYYEAAPGVEKFGYTDSGLHSSYVLTAGSSAAQLTYGLSRINTAIFRTPSGSDVKIYLQRNYYAYLDRTEKWLKSKSEEDGIETWTFNIPVQTEGYSWRVSKPGRLTKAGYFHGSSLEMTLTGEDKYSPDSTETTAGSGYMENSIMLTANSRNAIDLDVGDTFSMRAFRVWEIVSNAVSNYMIEPDFHTEILSGSDVIDVEEVTLGNSSNDKIKITAEKAGLAVIRVTYDAMEISGGDLPGIYGACDRGREGIVVIQAGSDNKHNVRFGISGSVERSTEWDAEFDTCYFFGDTGKLSMKPECDGGIAKVSMADPEALEWTDVKGNDGTYELTVKPGNNIVRVTTTDGESHYQIVRGCRYSVTITNLTREGKDPVAGDTVKIHLNGLRMPVPKMSGIYNPGFMQTGKVLFTDEQGNIVSSQGSQYDFITAQDLTVTIPGYGGGNYTLSNGYMAISIMGSPDSAGVHRSIPDEGLNRMFNAVSSAWRGSSLEGISIPVAETGKGVKFTGLLEGSSLQFVDESGLTFIPDISDEESITYSELPEGKYTYTITCDGYGTVSGEVELTSENTGLKEISVEQKANDPEVQAVIDAVKALPEADDITEEHIEAVDAAKEQYDSLSEDQKGYISEDVKNKLSALVHEVMILKDTDLMNVIRMVSGLPDPSDMTVESRAHVEQAEQAYEDLSSEQQSLMTDALKTKLTNAVKRMGELVIEKENKDAADEVKVLIEAIPAPADLTLEDKEQINMAKARYDSLTRQQKALISDSLKLDLQDAADRIKELEEQAEEEKQREAALKTAREEAINELSAFRDPSLYRETEKAILADAVTRGKAAIESAKTIEEVEACLISAKAEIALIKTDAELTAEENRKEEEKEAALKQAKESAKNELSAYKDPASYRNAEKEVLADAVARGKVAIDKAETIEEVSAALLSAKAEISLIKTDEEMTQEENQTEEERKAALEEAKSTAKEAITAHRDSALYRESEQILLADALRRGIEAIDAAVDTTYVRAAMEACIAEIDLIKTDEMLTEEERKAEEERIAEEARLLQEKINIAKTAKTKVKAKALKKHKAKITWKKLAEVSGYKVYRATKKKGKYRLIKTIKNGKTVKFTNKKLKKGKQYFYKVIPFTRIDGKVYTGKWSNIVKTKAR